LNRRKVNDEEACIKLVEKRAGDLQRETRLPSAAGPGEGQQSHRRVLRQEVVARQFDFALTPE
jgi:hypothetical protein